MLAMDFRAGQFREQNVSRHDHLLARRRPAAQSQRGAPITFVHHAVSHERIILAMIHHRQVEHLRVFAGAAHEFVVLDAMAVVGDGHDAGFFERTDGREFFAGDIFGDGAGDENIHDAFALRAFADERDGAGIVNRRRRVRHANDGGETAARRRRRSGGKIFLRGLAGFAQMDVQVNQAGTDDFSSGVEFFNFLLAREDFCRRRRFFRQ